MLNEWQEFLDYTETVSYTLKAKTTLPIWAASPLPPSWSSKV